MMTTATRLEKEQEFESRTSITRLPRTIAALVILAVLNVFAKTLCIMVECTRLIKDQKSYC